MARNSVKGNRRPKAPVTSTRYTQKTLMHDREYGFYWYAWLWKLIRPLLILMISMVIVLGIVSMGVSLVNNTFFAAPDPKDETVREFRVEQGQAVATVGNNLFEQGFIKNKGIFKYIVQFREMTDKIQYGSFPLSSAMDVNEVIDILAQGSASNENPITMIPGWTIKDFAAYLVKQGVLADDKEFLQLCNDADRFAGNSYALQDAIESKTLNRRTYQLEGYLAPDTYRVYKNATPQEIIERLLSQGETVRDRVFEGGVPEFDVTVNEEGERIDADGNVLTEEPEQFKTTLTKDQTIILASIIEKEAGTLSDYRKVSAVLHNRLIKGMRLECDSTINYFMGTSKLILTSDDLKTESPYNTYTNGGLPVGPICNPSEKALVAALYPDMDYVYSGYLYFCSKDPATTKELQFSITKAEHEAAVAQYRPLWIQYDEKQKAKQSNAGA